MPLEPGARLGPYEILSPLGSGGMGEVYRARDTRLGRDVAIKVLPEHLSAQPEIRARFEREAKTVSSLNHPHICVLFDVGREGDTDYLVLELIEGNTLADRLKRGPLPPAEILRYGTQIADALDRAHRAGVIHRDLKPGNIMITRSGAKLMDFGLSRAVGMAAAASGSNPSLSALTQSPTIAQALTSQGTLLGTFQYMAPEQLEGREADARSDIWSLGCVLYEMATGRRAFDGRSQASLIAAILEREPAAIGDVPSGSANSPSGSATPGLERLIRICLAKDPEDRIQTAHDIRLRLQEIAEGAGLSTPGVSASSVIAPAAAPGGVRPAARPALLPWALAAIGFLSAIAVFALLYPKTKRPPAPVFRYLTGVIPGASDIFWPRVSPDGKYLVVDVGDSTGATRAWIRPIDQLESHPIPGTEGLRRAYWSPDSREIAFVASGKMQRVAIAGGSPEIICAAPGGADLSWGSKGQILMDGSFSDSLRVVPAGGGDLHPASRIDRSQHEVGSAWPSFLPDGEHFLFIGNLANNASGGNIRLGRLGSLDSKLLGQSDGRVEYAAGGWILFVRKTSLMAQKLDLAAGKLTGQPITLTDKLRIGDSAGHFSISLNGILAFAQRDVQGGRALYRADRRGVMTETPIVSGTISNPLLSPDGHRVLYEKSPETDGEGSEISVFDLERNTDTQLTFTGGSARSPQWSPDGTRIAYVHQPRGGSIILRSMSADGLGSVDSLRIPPRRGAMLTQWSPVGPRFVLWDIAAGGAAFATPPGAGLKTPSALIDSTQGFYQPQISPDGRWVAGVIGQSPNYQVFVVSLTGSPGRWQISSSPAINPVWTKGGAELVFEGFDGRLMAVDIDTHSGFHAGTPHPLFKLPSQSFAPDQRSWGYDPAGEKFLLIVPPRPIGAGRIEVVSDFNSLVSRK